jgi:riboflavin kinase/FMN adenylyltransferase
LPARGVYICHAHLRRGTFPAITNVGTRPTFNHRPPTVEAYLLDFSADIYDAPMQLDFLHHLRPEVKFSSADALVEQMQRDEADTRSWLEAHPQAQPELACVTVGE